MSTTKYQQLLLEFCQLVRIDDASAVLESGSVEMNDIAFSLIHDTEEERTASVLCVYCDFGEIPSAADHALVMRRLLEVNLFLFVSPTACTFSINPETGHVLLCVSLDLHATDARMLAETLTLCTEEARRWRETHFLDDTDVTRVPRPHEAAARAVRL